MLPQHSPFYLANILLHNAVYILFILYAFKSKIQRGLRSVICWAVLYTVLTCVIVLLFLEQEALFPQYAVAAQTAWIAITILFCILFLKNDVLQMLFLILVTMNIQNNVIAIAKVIHSFNWVPRFTSFEAGSYLLLTVGVLVLYLPAIWLIYKRLFKRIIDTGVDYAYWRFLWMLPTTFIILLYSSSLSGVIPRTYRIQDLITLLFLNIASIAAYSVSLQMLIRTHDSMTAIGQAQLMSKQIELQKDEYKRLMEHIRETNVQRHDWRHHLLLIDSLVKNKDYEKLDVYLRGYMEDYQGENEVLVCENLVVDVILRHFISKAKEQSIEIDANVIVPGGLNIPDLNLCVVFGNLMENAIEACSMQESGRRFINIQSAIAHKQLLIAVENSFAVLPELINGVFRSTKREGEGFGITSVKKIAEADSGCLITDIQDGVFTVKVLLNIP